MIRETQALGQPAGRYHNICHAPCTCDGSGVSLSTIPSFVDQLEAELYSTDLNLVEWLILRAELLLELLRVLSGKFSLLDNLMLVHV